MTLKKLMHVFDYSGWESRRVYWNDNVLKIHAENLIRLRFQISNTLTTNGWTLVSLESILDNGTTTGFLVLAEKTLPSETVDKIVSIRRQADKILYDILSEPIVPDAEIEFACVWRGTSYKTEGDAADARGQAAKSAFNAYTDDAGLSDLLKQT
jgi:hypothetical protein